MNTAPPSDNTGTADQIQVLPSQQQQQQPHQHHQNAIDDMLNEEAVEEDDQAIECAEEADNKHRVELENSQNVLTNRTNNNNVDGLGLDHTNTFSSPPSYDQMFGNRLRCHGKIMRHHGNSKVTNVELFFDLVFVYASTILFVLPFPSFMHLLCRCCCFLRTCFLALHSRLHPQLLLCGEKRGLGGRVHENEVTGSNRLAKVKHEKPNWSGYMTPPKRTSASVSYVLILFFFLSLLCLVLNSQLDL